MRPPGMRGGRPSRISPDDTLTSRPARVAARMPGVRKFLVYGALALLLLLQYPLWVGSGSLYAVWQLREEIEAQKTENARLRERNATLEAEVADLKEGLTALEERARSELGMTRKGETFYHVIDEGSGKPAGARKNTGGKQAAGSQR